MKNKKAWIRLVEAVMAVLLVAVVLLVILNQQSPFDKNNLSESIFSVQESVLKKVQLNNTLRTQILNSDLVSTQDSNFPADIENLINEKIPEHLDCEAKICNIQDYCSINKLDEEIQKDIYVNSVSIFSDFDNYNPRQLKLFCWFK